jgi:hypothetical protein
LVTRVDQDFDIRRVQTQAEKFLPKAETLSRGRKRKAQTSKQKSSSVRWVKSVFEEKNIYFPIILSQLDKYNTNKLYLGITDRNLD